MKCQDVGERRLLKSKFIQGLASIIQHLLLPLSVDPWGRLGENPTPFSPFLGSELGVLGDRYSFVLEMLPGVGAIKEAYSYTAKLSLRELQD